MADTPQGQTQNPYAVQAAPFNEALQPQTYQSTAPPPNGGAMGKGSVIASFADKFLEGFSKGRKLQFDKTENQREKLNLDINDAYQRAASADLSEEQKAKITGQLDALKIASLKQHVDQSKDKQNPHIGMLKHAFDAKKYEFGPEQIHQTLSDVYKNISNPENQRSFQVTQAEKGVAQQFQQLQQKAQYNQEGRGQPVPGNMALYHDPSAKVTTTQLMADPAFVEAASKATQLNKGKPPAAVQGVLDQADLNQKYVDNLDLFKDQLKLRNEDDIGAGARAIQNYEKATGQKATEEIRRSLALRAAGLSTADEFKVIPGSKTVSGEDVKGMKTYDGKPADASGKTHYSYVSVLGETRLLPVDQTSHAVQKIVTADGRIVMFDPVSQTSVYAKDPSNPDQPLRTITSAGLAAIREGYHQGDLDRSAVVKVTTDYQKEIDRIKAEPGNRMNPQQKREAISQLEQGRDDLLGMIGERGKKDGSATPPKAKEDGKAFETRATDILNQLLNGDAPPKTATPPGGSASPANWLQ